MHPMQLIDKYKETQNTLYADIFMNNVLHHSSSYFNDVFLNINNQCLFYILENIITIDLLDFDKISKINKIDVSTIVNYIISNNRHIYNLNNFQYIWCHYYVINEENKGLLYNILNEFIKYKIITPAWFDKFIVQYTPKNDMFTLLNALNIYADAPYIICHLLKMRSYIYSYDINDILYILKNSKLITDDVLNNTELIQGIISSYYYTQKNSIIIADYYKDYIQTIYDNINISLLFCQVSLNYFIELFYFFRLILDKETELKFLKKLKNKKYFKLNILKRFDIYYHYKYSENKDFINGLIMLLELQK